MPYSEFHYNSIDKMQNLYEYADRLVRFCDTSNETNKLNFSEDFLSQMTR